MGFLMKWNVIDHVYENGVDRGVLYVKNTETGGYDDGVEWIGLTNVSLSPEGAEPNDIYADNVKYLSLMSAETLKGTIEAYQSPLEFDDCDGTNTIDGVSFGQQPRIPFAFCFRTKVGNGDNPEAGYKIHIVYGCLASPSERGYETINDSPEAMTLSWEFTTTPVAFSENIMKPTALITVDSTKVDPSKLAELEKYLYGTDGEQGTPARLPTPDQVLDMFSGQEEEPTE